MGLNSWGSAKDIILNELRDALMFAADSSVLHRSFTSSASFASSPSAHTDHGSRGTLGSPTPVGGASQGTICTSRSGALMRPCGCRGIYHGIYYVTEGHDGEDGEAVPERTEPGGAAGGGVSVSGKRSVYSQGRENGRRDSVEAAGVLGAVFSIPRRREQG